MEYTNVISTAALNAHLGEANFIICDCRHSLADAGYGRREYLKAHILGAQFVHLDLDLSAKPNGANGRHPLPSAEFLARKFGALGIDATKQVVCYDDAGGGIAGRMWWSLRWLGHHRVAVLDGGITKWIEEGRPTTDRVPAPEPANFVAQAQADFSVDADFVLQHLHDDNVLVLDARANDRFHGQNETIDPVGGHIPGAANRFFKDNLQADGTFKPAEALRAEFDALLAGKRADQVVNQCGSGVSACHNLLAMDIAGLSGSRLYPGSWSEWIADSSRPRST